MRLFSYIIIHDNGFAPNPFFGICTLACCKPRIRQTAEVGDWVIGLTPKKDGNKFIYAMNVTEKLRFEDYWRDSRFICKRPNLSSAKYECRRGDNIYRPLIENPLYNEDYEQQESIHKEEHKKHDLNSRFVLVSNNFYYFGADNAVTLPEELDYLIVGRAHKCRFSSNQIANTISFIKSLPKGYQPLSLNENKNEPCQKIGRKYYNENHIQP